MPASQGEAGGKVPSCPLLWTATRCVSSSVKSVEMAISEPIVVAHGQASSRKVGAHGQAHNQEGLP